MKKYTITFECEQGLFTSAVAGMLLLMPMLGTMGEAAETPALAMSIMDGCISIADFDEAVEIQRKLEQVQQVMPEGGIESLVSMMQAVNARINDLTSEQ